MDTGSFFPLFNETVSDFPRVCVCSICMYVQMSREWDGWHGTNDVAGQRHKMTATQAAAMAHSYVPLLFGRSLVRTMQMHARGGGGRELRRVCAYDR